MHTFRLLIMVCALSLGACAANGVAEMHSENTRQWLLSGESIVAGGIRGADLPEEDVLILDEDMKAFLANATAGKTTARDKVSALLSAVIGPASMGIRYNPSASFTPRETFARREANCLSFTLMMVAMLRHIGIDARFNDVNVPLLSDLRDESTLVFYKHINAIVQFSELHRAVLDLNMQEYDTSYIQEEITDNAAVAQYYNNRAMEILQQGQFEPALRYLVKAIALHPHVSYLWSNLGSLYQRAGKLQQARAAFEIALGEDSRDLVAMSNAARLYAVLGDARRAAELSGRVARFRAGNPYYRYVQAVNAYLHADYDGARQELTEAIRLYKQEHRFHFLLGAAYEKLGMHEAAEQSMHTALELATDEKQIARYRDKFDRLRTAQF